MVALGTILSGRYLLEEELGSGGMGTVYRAQDLRTGAPVAVKLPHPALMRDRAYAERLRREAQIAASFSSPRVARVTDVAEHQGQPYLVMEYVHGETLADRLARDGALAPADALRVAIEVARALDAAQQHGITHRDLKPQNIRLTDTDVKVLDFGVARVEGQPGLTAAGDVVGSPEYLAPERMDEPGDIRSDIYSLGVVLYQMLTGRVPFDGGTPWTLLRRHATEPPPPLPPGLPDAVYPIVGRCLAKRPAERYQTPRDLITVLQAALRAVDQAGPDSSPTGLRPLPPPPPSAVGPTLVLRTDPRPAGAGRAGAGERRRGVRWPYLAAGAAVAVAALAAVLILRRGGNDARPAAVSAPVEAAAPTSAASPAAGAPAAPTLTVVSPADGAEVTSPVRLELQAGNVTLKPGTERDPNGRHLHYFLDTDPALVLGPGQPVPTGSQNIIHSAAITQTLDFAPGPHTIWVVMTDNDHIPINPRVGAVVHFIVGGTPARTGDQAPLVYQSLVEGKWQLYTMDGSGRNVRRLSAGRFDDIEPAWAPDGSKIAFVSQRDGHAHIFTMNADGSGVQQVTRGVFDDRTPVWSPDGASLAFSSNREGGRDQIFVMPAGGGEPRQVTRGAGGGFEPAWAPDGARLAFVREQDGVTHIFVVDAGGGEPRQLTSANQRHIDPAWSPDGRRLAFSAFRDNRWNIFVMNADGSGVQKLTGGDPQDRHPAWSPDGRQIVFASGRDGQLQLYALPLDGGQVRTLSEGLAHSLHPSWPRR